MSLTEWTRRTIYTYARYIPVLKKIINWKNLVYSCETKVKYTKESSAVLAVVEMNAKRTTRNELENYKCLFCNGWHLGRKNHYKRRMKNKGS